MLAIHLGVHIAKFSINIQFTFDIQDYVEEVLFIQIL